MMIGNHSPNDIAKVISKRPGMYLRGSAYDHAIGLLAGSASLAALRSIPGDEAASTISGFSAADDSGLITRIAEVQRKPKTRDCEAIRALESLLTEAPEEAFCSNSRLG